MKSLKVTVVSEVTELQEMTVKVPNEFPSWSQDEQESFLGAKVKESFQEHNDSLENASRHGMRVEGVTLNGDEILDEFLIQPNMSAAGCFLLEAIRGVHTDQPDLALYAMKAVCKSLKVPVDTVGALVQSLQKAEKIESSVDPDTNDPSPGV